MFSFKCFIFFALFLPVWAAERPCHLYIYRDGLPLGRDSCFICVVNPRCSRAGNKIIGPFWWIDNKWLSGIHDERENASGSLNLAIMQDTFGDCECRVKIDNLVFKAGVELIEYNRLNGSDNFNRKSGSE